MNNIFSDLPLTIRYQITILLALNYRDFTVDFFYKDPNAANAAKKQDLPTDLTFDHCPSLIARY
jgi:hypothetical protein